MISENSSSKLPNSRLISDLTAVSYTHLDVYKRQEVTEDGPAVKKSGRYSGHTGTTEAVENNISLFGVMLNKLHDSLVGHLGMVRMGVVDGIIFTFADVADEGFPVVVVSFRIIGLTIALDKIVYVGVGAGGVVGRVG